jgi:hypothetical protein
MQDDGRSGRDPGRPARAGPERQPLPPRPRLAPPPEPGEELDEPTPAEAQQIREAMRSIER